jgi:hypothetical protein
MRKNIQIQWRAIVPITLTLGLVAFELFNFSTTEFALTDILGNSAIFGLRWASILSIAFCAIDFAGIARIFTPERGADEPIEVWFLFGAWLLAAAMNATLTWWGVAVSVTNHVPEGTRVVGVNFMHNVVPAFVALMVFIIRVLLVSVASFTGERFFAVHPMTVQRPMARALNTPGAVHLPPTPRPTAPPPRPMPRPIPPATEDD